MPHMIIRETGHGEITMIIPILPPHIDFPLPLGRLDKVLGQELALLVEVVRRALHNCSASARHLHIALIEIPRKREHTTSIKTSSGSPDHFFTSSVASWSAHFALLLVPKYPSKAFWPHGHWDGLAMGANAETDLYLPGFFRN